MTFPEWDNAFVLLKEAFPARGATEATSAAYFALLQDLPTAVVAESVHRVAMTSKFFPTVAEIRNDVARAALGVSDPEAVLAEILDAIHDRGWTSPPKHGDLSPVAEAVVAAAGWQSLCSSENPEALRAHVLRLAGTFGSRLVERGNLASAGLLPAAPCVPVERALPGPIGDVVKGLLGAGGGIARNAARRSFPVPPTAAPGTRPRSAGSAA